MSSGKSTTSIILQEIIKEKISKEQSLSVNIFTAFTMIGILCAAFFTTNTSIQDPEHGLYGPASIVIWSYLTALVSLGCILLIKNIGNPDYMFSGTTSIGGVFTIFLMIWIVSINLKHFKNINMNVVPKQYFDYSGWSYLLLFIQSAFLFVTLDSNSSSKTEEKRTVINRISILNNIIIFLSFILVLIQQIILDKFSVDVL